MQAKDLQGWYPIPALVGQCATCKYKLTEHRLAACEYGQPWFPQSKKCVRFEPEDMDE